MHTDFLIIGQGIAGTLLSRELLQAGKSVMVIDAPNKNKASLVASAVINPLIGKKNTITKESKELIDFAVSTYKDLEEKLNDNFIRQKNLFIFQEKELEKGTITNQITIENPYVKEISEAQRNSLAKDFYLENNVGSVHSVFTVDAHLLSEKWRNYLKEKNSFWEDKFDFEELKIVDGNVVYKNFIADKLVFCEGAIGRNNPYFPNQKFTANRGDVLLINIPELSTENLYQNGIRLVPKTDGLFWFGSNYTWKYDSLMPDKNWRLETESKLKSWLKIPFEIVDHLVAERPTTAGQIPILSTHEKHKNIFFFNGFGTKGFSAGPSLARKMADLTLNLD